MLGTNTQKIQETANTVSWHVDTNSALTKSGLAGGGAVASYLTLNQWVAIATLIFVVLQIGLLIPRYIELFRAWREGKKIKVDLD